MYIYMHLSSDGRSLPLVSHPSFGEHFSCATSGGLASLSAHRVSLLTGDFGLGIHVHMAQTSDGGFQPTAHSPTLFLAFA